MGSSKLYLLQNKPMRFTNIDERKRQRRTFILLYAGTVVLLVFIGAAFILARPAAASSNTSNYGGEPLQAIPVATPIAKEKDTTAEIDLPLAENATKVDSLVLEIKERDRQIAKLREKQRATPSRPVVSSGSNEEDLKFLRWALSSQSAEVTKLKNENARLKAKVQDLPK